jgi:hypothetical protein
MDGCSMESGVEIESKEKKRYEDELGSRRI